MKKALERIVYLLDHALNCALILFALIVLCVSGYSLLDNAQIYHYASDTSLQQFKPVVRDEERSDSSFVFLDHQSAWLCIDNTYVDYPVMQAENNFEYLNKDPYGEYRISGSIFLDWRNAPDFSDEFSMIYGHHMDHYNMFGSLDLFTSEAYFLTHTAGWLATRNGIYDLELFAVVWGDAKDYTVFNPQGRMAADVLSYIEDKAEIYTAYKPGAKIIALSTCAGENETSRLLVFAMILDRDEEKGAL
ncbi:MAG: class B sortase [Clostridia bacterium]|nr:class B sortase [Clostridia bacterium]